MINILFESVLKTSWVVSIVLLFILLLRKVMGTRIGIKSRQLIWAIILLRLILPLGPESHISLMNLIPTPAQIIQTITEVTEYRPLDNASQKQEVLSTKKDITDTYNTLFYKQTALENNIQNHNVNIFISTSPSSLLIEKLVFFWAAGFILFLGVSVFSLARFRHINKNREKNASLTLFKEFFYCKDLLKINKKISLKLLPELSSPILTGIFHPKIYLPETLIEHTGIEERLHILLHELVHWKRKDTLWNLVLLLALSIHWFNPLMWIASQKIKEDLEMCCDAAVLEVIGEEKATSYGNAILQVVKFQNKKLKSPLYQTAFYANNKQTKRRIIMINKFHAGMTNKITTLALILCIVLGITTLTNSPSYADKNSYNYETPSKFQLFDPSYQYFHDLNQFCRYADFSFQLPNYLPTIFEVYDYRINRDNNQTYLTVNYWYNTMSGAMVAEAKEEHFQLRISKSNLLKMMSPQLTEEQKQKSTFIVTYKSTPKVLSGISGNQLTIWMKDKQGHPSGGDNTYKEDKTEYFIWEKQGVWYALEYLTEVTMEKQSYYLLNLSDNEVARVINSFTNPKEITHKGYFLKEEMPSFAVYDEKDLKRVASDWFFSPRLPMELPGLKAKSARMSHAFYDNKEFGIFEVSYISKENPSSKVIAEYKQPTQQVIYESVQKMYQEQQNRALKTNEATYTLQTINGKKVYALEEKNKTTEKMHYYWDNGTFTINGKLGDHIDILKILVN